MRNIIFLYLGSIIPLILLSSCCSTNVDEFASSFVEESNDNIWFDNYESDCNLKAAYLFSRESISVYLANCSETDLLINMSDGTYFYAVKYKTRSGRIDYCISPFVMGLNCLSELVVLRKLPQYAPSTSMSTESSTSFSIRVPYDCVEIIALSVTVMCLDINAVHFNSADELLKAFSANSRKLLAQDIGKGNLKRQM